MKRFSVFIFLFAAFLIASCNQSQTPISPKDDLGYYIYNPEDTIANEPFYNMLWIDSTRIEYFLDHIMDSIAYPEAETKWHELMTLCANRQYEEVLSCYTKEDAIIGIALGTSTLKFELDYYVIGKLLFDVLDEDEAIELLVKFFEYDKFQTESVLAFSLADGGSGYVPPQYAFLLERLCYLYIRQEEWDKIDSLLEPHREAVYLLSDDVLVNEQHILTFKLDIFGAKEDWDAAKQAFVEYRDFLIHYVAETGEDLSREIENINEIIEDLQEQPASPRVNANA